MYSFIIFSNLTDFEFLEEDASQMAPRSDPVINGLGYQYIQNVQI